MIEPIDWSNPDLTPDQFLYGRSGPWPQPSPSHPLKEAGEVLNVPSIETLLWNNTIGARYLQTQVFYPAAAAAAAVADLARPTPTDDEFNEMMLNTAYSRFLKKEPTGELWKYDFSAMTLVEPLTDTYCAPVVCHFKRDAKGTLVCVGIQFRRDEKSGGDLLVRPGQNAWNLAKIYALQGAAYHMLFVVHPALHFPMDSVNAITKTAVPHIHPLFQLLYPHASYSLQLDNAVLEGAQSVVNDQAQATWFDPLTGNAYNLKLLFGAGYTGLKGSYYGDAYPAYDYMNPQKGFASDYGRWLNDYYEHAFLPFCRTVADVIVATNREDPYVLRWARYCSTYVLGFPDEKAILDPACLAQAMAIFLWDVTVSHGGDHYSFALNIPAAYKYLRVRVPPPKTPEEHNHVKTVGDVTNNDDLYRAEMAQRMFFTPWAIEPNLIQTNYAFLHPGLLQAQKDFHEDLKKVNSGYAHKKGPFMPLTPPEPDQYALTIPASIQY